jgi:hypothetical protein
VQDFGDDLLDRCCVASDMYTQKHKVGVHLPFGSDRSSLPPNSRSDMVGAVCGVFAPSGGGTLGAVGALMLGDEHVGEWLFPFATRLI